MESKQSETQLTNLEPETEYAIETHGLTKKFGSYVAVSQMDLQVVKGSIFGFLGPNGSGKSTTIRMLCGVLIPTAGKAWIMGYDVEKETEKVRQTIGYMSQKFGLYDDLTIGENLIFYAGIYGLHKKNALSRQGEILEKMGLTEREHQLAATLSGGWKQRLALGCALIHGPKLLILDEPTAGVDPVSRRSFWEMIQELAKSGITILVTTHYMDEAQACDTVAFIYNGKLLLVGKPADIIAKEGVHTLEDVFIKMETGYV